jgi:hypothetical protein
VTKMEGSYTGPAVFHEIAASPSMNSGSSQRRSKVSETR